jgi:hypothetical protein
MHGGTLPDARSRARQFFGDFNRRHPDSSTPYSSHRKRLMDWVGAVPGSAIAVLGAGNGSDLDLEQLAGTFARVHLVDLDGEALERARARQSGAVQARIVLHPDSDLSGFLKHLDSWSDWFPEPTALGSAAVAAARELALGLGRTFDVVLSTCVLSQLALPFQRAWVAPRKQWANLLTSITAVHLATVAGSVAPGGRGLIAFDVASSRLFPELAELSGATDEAVAAFVAEQRARGKLVCQPEPEQLLALLGTPGLGSLVAEPRLTPAWLWDLGDRTQLVYGVEFLRPTP